MAWHSSATMSCVGQFSLKRMFASVTLLAIGMAMLVFLFRHVPRVPPLADELLFLAGGATIGAAILLPVKRAWLGAILGLTILVLFQLTTSMEFMLK